MTDAEAMMWAIERDPWLSPSGGSVTVFDQPLDFERFHAVMSNVVGDEPRLRQHVVDPFAPVTTPHWEIDHEFDLDWHVRRRRVPGTGSLRELLDWTTLFLQDPYDRSRPLWQYVVLDGLEGGQGALAVKIHHVAADGYNAVRLTSAYGSLERNAPVPDELDVDAFVANEPDDHSGVGQTMAGAVSRPLAAGRAILGTITRPPRMREVGREVESALRTAGDQLHPAGSPLWQQRSRRRRAEVLSLPFDAAHDRWKALGGTLNDFFVTGVAEGAFRYHRALDSELQRLHMTFVVSTRRSTETAANAFTPVPVDVPAGPMDPRARFETIRDLLHARRADVHGGGPMAAVATIANLMPTSVVANVARSQARHIDIATSNLPGYLGDSYVAGAKTRHTYILGPVAGTACNITLHTTAGSIDIGLHVDPVAIADPRLLRDSIEGSLHDLMAAA